VGRDVKPVERVKFNSGVCPRVAAQYEVAKAQPAENVVGN
jgi:hypothetical protein